MVATAGHNWKENTADTATLVGTLISLEAVKLKFQSVVGVDVDGL